MRVVFGGLILSVLLILISVLGITKHGPALTDKAELEAPESVSMHYDVIEWKDDPKIGKVQPGYYKRVGIAKGDMTYEEMLELNEAAGRGCLIINDDGTAVFELDGEKTEYVYDEFNLYLAEDTARTDGFRYTFIGGRLLVDDGSTITQYLKMSDEEMESYSED